MENVDFIATLKYRTTNEGGRQTPAASGYRPAVRFSFDKMMTSGIQTFIDKEIVYPGDTIEAAIKMLSWQHFVGRLEEGMEFDFREGDRIIGTGIITKIVNGSLKKGIMSNTISALHNDKHLTEADAYGKPDQGDKLLSAFSMTEGKGKKSFLQKIKLAIIDSIRKSKQ